MDDANEDASKLNTPNLRLDEEIEIEKIKSILTNIPEMMDAISDEHIKKYLREGINEISDNINIISKKLANPELKKLELQSQIESAHTKMAIETSKNRANTWSKFLQKELVATIVGAILLIIIISVYAIAMFKNIVAPEILNNAFLLILGYFFGQTASKSS